MNTNAVARSSRSDQVRRFLLVAALVTSIAVPALDVATPGTTTATAHSATVHNATGDRNCPVIGC